MDIDLVAIFHFLRLSRNNDKVLHNSLQFWSLEGNGEGLDLSVLNTSLYRTDNRDKVYYDTSFRAMWWEGNGQYECYQDVG